jgi:hypothetical protein
MILFTFTKLVCFWIQNKGQKRTKTDKSGQMEKWKNGKKLVLNYFGK